MEEMYEKPNHCKCSDTSGKCITVFSSLQHLLQPSCDMQELRKEELNGQQILRSKE